MPFWLLSKLDDEVIPTFHIAYYYYYSSFKFIITNNNRGEIMKLSVVQENLHRALGSVSRVVGSRNSLPVLANVLLKTEASRLVVSATNLEIAISCSIGCKVEKEGATSVPARLLSELISGLPSDKLQLVANGDNLKIKTTNFESQLNGIAASEFPTTPKVTPEAVVTVPAEILVSRLSEVVVAASADEARPVLAGVLFSIESSTLTLAATDSYRLAETKLSVKADKDISVIVPAKTVNELIRIVGDSSEDVTISVGKTEILFEIGDISMVSRLIEGKFPNYTQIIPTKSATSMILSKSELVSVVKVTSLFARESAHTIKLEFTETGLQFSARASEVGENSSIVESSLNGKPADISINARYLLDVLGVINTPQVELAVNDKLDPCLVKPVTKKGEADNYIHIIMPLRS